MFAKILSYFGKSSDSPAGTATKQDLLNSLRTAAIVGLSGGIVLFLQKVSEADFGPLSALAVPAIAAAIDYVRRVATDYTK